MPLAIVLTISMIQAFLEDLRRYYSDIQVNSQPCRVVVCVNGQGQYKEKYWQHVRLGEIVVLQSGEEVPADCILLSSESAVGDGTCLVETSQLDGETSRKLREPTSDTARATKLQDVAQLKGSVTLGPPSAQLDVFTASLRLNGCAEKGGEGGVGRGGRCPNLLTFETGVAQDFDSNFCSIPTNFSDISK